jgi:hypothetical protein
MSTSKLPTARNVPARPRLSRRAGVTRVITDLEFANAKLVEMGMAGQLIGESDRWPIGRSHGRNRGRAYRQALRQWQCRRGSVSLPSDSRSALSRFADRREVVLNQERRRHRDPGKIRHVSVVSEQQNLA